MDYEDINGLGGLGFLFDVYLFSKVYIFIYLFQESTQSIKAYDHVFHLSTSTVTLSSI